MGEEVKFYCDECGKEVWGGKWVNIAVFAYGGYQKMPSNFSLERYNKIPFNCKEIYNKMLCYGCVGEGVREQGNLEPYPSFSLKEQAREFLIKHKFLKERR